jgi:myo-inositol-1(or 4)-monophosphatase
MSAKHNSLRPVPRESLALLERVLISTVRGAGDILLEHFGQVTHPRQKDGPSSVVCDADLAAERYVLRAIRQWFPKHNTVAEESGVSWRSSEYTWVIDPLDGTSNFVAGIPWFGVQIAVLHREVPVAAAMYLPTENTLYRAVAGGGAYCNERRVSITKSKSLQKVLCAFGFDPDPVRRQRPRIELLFRVSQLVRNTRATNSLVDFCYTIDGRLGACINLKTKIWDIAPVSLILPEAGGRFTYPDGREIIFEFDAKTMRREYAILAGARALHTQLLQVTRPSGR